VSEYVKFSCEPLAGDIASFSGLAELNAYRRKLLDLHLIGEDPKGIGFGNLSVREGATKNFISQVLRPEVYRNWPWQTAQK
jgi:hypothetical protein